MDDDMYRNWIELGLDEEEEAKVREAAKLHRIVHLDTIDNVFKIAAGIEILRKRHTLSGKQRGGFEQALVQYGFVDRDGGPLHKSIRSDYTALLREEPKVRAWWATVPERRKRFWLSARALHRHWKNTQKSPDPQTPRPPPSRVAADHRDENTRLNARVAELEAELDRVRSENPGAKPQTAPSDELLAARKEIKRLRAENVKLSDPKALAILQYEYEVRACNLENDYIARLAKQARDSAPPVQINDDVQIEVNRWLELLLPELHKERSKARKAIVKRKGIVPKATFNLLRRAVHPDTGPHVTVKVRDAAMKVLNALKPYVLSEADEPTEWDSDLPNDLAGWAKRLHDAEVKRRMRDIPNPKPMPLPPFLKPKATK
jgi:hypothetical protein